MHPRKNSVKQAPWVSYPFYRWQNGGAGKKAFHYRDAASGKHGCLSQDVWLPIQNSRWEIPSSPLSIYFWPHSKLLLCLFLKYFYWFIYFWLCWVVTAAPRLSLVAVWGLLTGVASLVVEHRLWPQELQKLWCMGFIALKHVGSSQTRDRTCVTWTDRQILNHWTTREAL